MIKIALVLMILGIVNAVIAAGVTCYLNSQHPPNRAALQAWSRSTIAVLLWPSGIMMMAADSSGPVGTGIILAFSVIANAFLYAVVGLGVGAVWEKFTTAKQ